MASEFDYACVSHPDELDDVERGVTIGGLVKRNSRRYEKDDRHEVGDATRWVLGGDTHARLEALLERRRDAMAAMEEASARDAEADSFRQDAVSRRDVFTRVSTFSWDQVDLASAMAVTAAQRDDLRVLTSESGTLREAQEAAERATQRLDETNAKHARALGAHAVARNHVESIAAHVAELEATPYRSRADRRRPRRPVPSRATLREPGDGGRSRAKGAVGTLEGEGRRGQPRSGC
jgi:uncharacterized protein YPO0396